MTNEMPLVAARPVASHPSPPMSSIMQFIGASNRTNRTTDMTHCRVTNYLIDMIPFTPSHPRRTYRNSRYPLNCHKSWMKLNYHAARPLAWSNRRPLISYQALKDSLTMNYEIRRYQQLPPGKGKQINSKLPFPSPNPQDDREEPRQPKTNNVIKPRPNISCVKQIAVGQTSESVHLSTTG